MRPLVLLRPEPGLSASAARAEALGMTVIRHALFRVEPVPASPPDGPFEAVVLTSANAARCGSALLRTFRSLPLYAVGEATADAARAAGLTVTAVGSGGVEGLDLPGGRLLHLCGENHRPIGADDTVALPVYRMVPTIEPLPGVAGSVIAVHSPAAGERLDALMNEDRSTTTVAAISKAAAADCGTGWRQVASAVSPDDSSLLALAATLCQSDSL